MTYEPVRTNRGGNRRSTLAVQSISFFVFEVVLGLIRLSGTADARLSAAAMAIETYGANVTLEPANCSDVAGNLTLVFLSPFDGKYGFMSNAVAVSLAVQQAQSDGLIACSSVQ